jgi:hypothetical protein
MLERIREIEAWEYDRTCPLDDVIRLASERLTPPSFRGRVLAREGDAITVTVAGGAPTGAPDSLYYVADAGPFQLTRLALHAEGGLLVTLRAIVGAQPPRNGAPARS